MHQTSCGNGFPILEKEGLEGVNVVCKPLIAAAHEQVSLAVLGQIADSVFLCMYMFTQYIEDVEFGTEGLSNQGVLLLPGGRLQPGFCWHNMLSHRADGIFGTTWAARG